MEGTKWVEKCGIGHRSEPSGCGNDLWRARGGGRRCVRVEKGGRDGKGHDRGGRGDGGDHGREGRGCGGGGKINEIRGGEGVTGMRCAEHEGNGWWDAASVEGGGLHAKSELWSAGRGEGVGEKWKRTTSDEERGWLRVQHLGYGIGGADDGSPGTGWRDGECRQRVRWVGGEGRIQERCMKD